MNDIETSLWSFPDLRARMTNGKWTHARHRLAGLALILLFVEGASKLDFADLQHLASHHGAMHGNPVVR